MKNALIIIDVQNDFFKGGALEVPDSDDILPVINDLRKTIPFNYFYLSADWHPTDHVSFASNHPGKSPFQSVTLQNGNQQDVWPDHCIQNQPGSAFKKELITTETDIIIRKGKIQNVESCSAFGSPPDNTGLEQDLKDRNVQKIFFVGLCLDVCVKESAIDGAMKGYIDFFCLYNWLVQLIFF